MPYKFDKILKDYIYEIKSILGEDFLSATLYGSAVRNEMTEESDIDIAIFTNRRSEDFYEMINKIAGITFEYSTRFDLMLSPVFINNGEYQRMVKILPYYQSIQKEGVTLG